MADRDTSIPGNQIKDDSINQTELDITNTPTNGQIIQINMPAGDFTATSGTWTVASADLGHTRYRIVGKTLFWSLDIAASTTASTITALVTQIPQSKASANATSGLTAFVDNGTETEYLKGITTDGGTTISWQRVGSTANMTDGSDTVTFSFTIFFEID